MREPIIVNEQSEASKDKVALLQYKLSLKYAQVLEAQKKSESA